jgi:hypothetical protein
MGKLLRAEPEGSKFLDGYPQTKECPAEGQVVKIYSEIQRISQRSYQGLCSVV